MIRRLLVPLLGAGLLLAMTAGSAFAKCEGPNPPEFCKTVAVSLNVGGGGVFHAGTVESVTIDVSLSEQPYEANAWIRRREGPLPGGAWGMRCSDWPAVPAAVSR